MRLYSVRGDLAFGLLQPIPDGSWVWRGGVAVAEPWVTPEFTLLDRAVSEFVAADCFTMNTGTDGFVLSEFARLKLEPLLGPNGEFWPVRVVGRSYWWFNCLTAVEALDRRRTDADWSTVAGAWGSFRWITATRRLAFQTAKLMSPPGLFRVPEYPQGVLFGSEALKEAVAQHELSGFRFDVIWSSEDGGVTDPPGVGFGGVFDETPVHEAERRRRDAKAVLARRARGQ